MELNKIYTRTTWNDAAEAINTNNLKINQAIEELRRQSGGVGDISVTTDKIVNGAVTTQKIAHQAVTSDKIAPNTITEEHLSQELTDGTYPNVTVGNATKAATADTATKADFATDLTGRVEATPEVFTYRPSAGDKSIKDDNAFIRRVKGNSVVWNQLVNGSAYSNTQTKFGLQCSIALNSREIRVVGTYANNTPTSDRNWYDAGALTYHTTGIVGHKYLCQISGNKECSLTVYGWCSGSTDIFDSIIKECTANTKLTMAIKLPLVADGTQIDETIIIDIHDLTAMFGAGNEPTAEGFRALYPNSYYPYNAGELRNLVCSGIKTVGFNQWDGTTQVGYIDDKTGVVTSSSSYLCTDFIRVIPNQEYYINTEQTNGRWGAWYDANKNYVAGILNYDQVYTAPANAAYVRLTIKTANGGNPDTFCINLHHTGYRDGEHAPYKEVTHALPLSQITNGEPLRKAGSVYDEINETEYIKRVGVVDLGSLNWVYDSPNACFKTYGLVGNASSFNFFCSRYTVSNYGFAAMPDKSIRSTSSDLSSLGIKDSAFTTDASALKASLSGVLLHYELDEPIVKPIETPIDFNYYVEDFGTEEAILAENSAPFSADIIYQFNATDQVRNNTRNIQRLKKTAFKPSGSTSQYIRGDGSYADVSELSRVIPIYDGEEDKPDDSPYDNEFRLFPQQYAKLKVVLDGDSTILVRIEAPENSNIVAEYWLEIDVDSSRPTIEFVNSENDNIEDNCRFNGEVQTFAKNIWHIITTDGGTKFMGEIKNYVF